MNIFKRIRSLFFSEKDSDQSKNKDEVQYRKELQEWNKRAYLLGRNEGALDNLLNEIKTRFSQVRHSIIEPLQAEIMVFEKSLKDTLDALSSISENKEEAREDYYTRAKQAIEAKKADGLNRIRQIDRKLKANKARKAEADAEIFAGKLKKVKKKFFDTLIPTVIIVLATIGIDTPITWVGVEESLDTVPLAAFLISIGISGFLGMIGHLAGDCLTNRKFRMGSIWLILGIVLLLTIVGMRWNVDGNLLMTAAILMVLFITSVLISMRYHRNRDQLDVVFDADRLEALIDRLEDERDNELNEIHKLDNEADTKASDYVDKYKADLLSGKKSSEESIYKLKSKVAAEMKGNADLESKTISEVKDSYNKGSGGDGPNMRAAMITLIFAGAMFLSSTCFGQVMDVGVAIDKSLSRSSDQELRADDIFEGIVEILLIDTAEHYSGGANVYLTHIGQNSIPKVISIHLEEGGNWLIGNRKDRKEEVVAFLIKLKAGIDQVLALERKQRYTNIYRTLIHAIEHFSSDSDEHHLISIGDQLETSFLTNMAADKYTKNPAQLEADYAQLSSILLSDLSFPKELDELRVLLIYDVDPAKEELSYRASRFWKRFFETEAKAMVRIKASF